MKKLLFVLLLCGCATAKPPEVALDLPQPVPQQYKPLPPIPQPRGFTTNDYVQMEHDRMLQSLNEFMQASDLTRWLLAKHISEVITYMEAIVESIKPGIDLYTIIERQRILTGYMDYLLEISKFERRMSDKVDDLNVKANNSITRP